MLYSTFNESFNSGMCAIMKLGYDGINGQLTKEWAGVDNIIEALDSSPQLTNEFTAEYSSAFALHSNLLTEAKNFEDNILIKETTLGTATIQSPNPTSTTMVIPIFLRYYSPSTDNTKTLYKILNEYLTNIKPSINALIQLETAAKGIMNQATAVNNELSSISGDLASLRKVFEGIDESIANNLLTAYTIGDILFIVYLVLMIIILSIAVLLIILSSLFKCKRFLSLRYILHVLWNINFFFIIVGFIICSLTGMFTIIAHDIIVAIDHIFTEEYMASADSIFPSIPKTQAKFLDICFNGDGDLTALLGVNKQLFNLLDDFYVYSYKIDQLNKGIADITESKAAIEENELYIKYQSNIPTTTDASYGIDDITFCLGELSIWTDSGLSNTVQPGCSTRTYDNWVANVQQCPYGYTYSPNGIHLKNCLLIPNWTKPSITLRYNPACDASGIPITTGAHKHFDPLLDYYTTCDNLLNSILSGNRDFSTKYASMLLLIKEEYGNIEGLIKAIRAVYSPIVPHEGSLYDMINCAALKEDVLQFYDNIGRKFYTMSTASIVLGIIACLCSYAAMYFTIDVIYRYEQIIIDRDDEEEEDGKENPNDKAQEEEEQISEGTPQYNPESNKEKDNEEDPSFEENPMYSILFRNKMNQMQSDMENEGNPSVAPLNSIYNKKKIMMPIKRINVANNNFVETASNLRESNRIELTKE